MSKESISAQLGTFRLNIRTELRMECMACNNAFSKSYGEGTINNYDDVKKYFAKEAYENGWRESYSKVFHYKGIFCPECHKNRDNAIHFVLW